MLVTQNCVVADPPEYRAPEQTRPLLDVYGAVPTATRVLVVTKEPGSIAHVNFNVRVQSEDAGEGLKAIYFLDYGTAQQSKLLGQTIPASTYNDTGRAATLSWPVNASNGCHFVTLVVAHSSSFQSSNDDRLEPTKADEDASLLVWTVNVNPSSLAPNTLANCPTTVAPAVGQ